MQFFLTGFMGSGKSFWGEKIAAHLHLPFIDLDRYIAEKEGCSLDVIFELKGESYFRERETYHLKELISNSTNFIMATGGGTPCFYDNMILMNQHGITIYLRTSIHILYERLSVERSLRPLLHSLDDDALESYIERKIQERKLFYEQAAYIVESNSINESTFEQIFLQYV